MTEDDRRDLVADVFTVAMIKGAVEGDVYRHFGSLGGAAQHLATARRLWLIDVDDEDTATPRGQDLYRRHRLDLLPEGRAYLAWQGSPIVEATLAELLPDTTSPIDHTRCGADRRGGALGAGPKFPVPCPGSVRHRDISATTGGTVGRTAHPGRRRPWAAAARLDRRARRRRPRR
ncbi:hypothetical protein [Saccharothrix lopnurensis]|uniref:Uncharacterized protein n=1 Tax=Saccharothrix lopnurensis TaxID=1670621 RepID=A0ABW1PGT3_9PSEU